MDDKSLDGWPADLTRASIVWILYAAGVFVTYVAMYIFSWAGLALFLLMVFLGPFVLARLACRVIRPDRPLVPTLGWGFLLGLIFFIFLGVGVLKIAQKRNAEAKYTGTVYASIVAGPLLGAVTFSRLKRWSSD